MLHLQPWLGKHYRYWFDLFQGFSRATLTGKLWETYSIFDFARTPHEPSAHNCAAEGPIGPTSAIWNGDESAVVARQGLEPRTCESPKLLQRGSLTFPQPRLHQESRAPATQNHDNLSAIGGSWVVPGTVTAK